MPTTPPAPGLLITTTGWPSSGASFSAMMRATMSTVPPAAVGTNNVDRPVGKAGRLRPARARERRGRAQRQRASLPVC